MTKRIVVLGGGFGGLAAAQHLDRILRYDDGVDITLVSDTNYLVYTPLLADVAGGTIEPRYTMPPLRKFLRHRAVFREGAITGVDVANQTVAVTYAAGDWDEWKGKIGYDYLVIALGATTSFKHGAGAQTYALGLKDVVDAGFLRNRILTTLEWAVTTPDPQTRRELLTFVVAGGGFSGVEGVAALEDLAHGALRYYPTIQPSELRFILAPHGNRLLPEVDQRLGEYVVKKFQDRTIDVRLGVGVTEVTARSATLTTGELIPTRTVVWTAGVEVNPLLHRVDLPKERHGALIVNNRLQVEGHPNVFAVGDCAAVPVSTGEGSYAPTAQNAIREGPVAAHNIACLIHNIGDLRAFDYRPMGSLASLGHRQAVAQIGRLQLSGLPGWLAWRGIYLLKLPTITDRMLVLLDWVTDLFAPVDIAQIPQGRQQRVLPGKKPVEPAIPAAEKPTAPEEQPARGETVPS